jgi:opacity protein-like surface antigen
MNPGRFNRGASGSREAWLKQAYGKKKNRGGERHMKRFLSIVVTLMTAVMLMAAPAGAQTQAATTQEDHWQFEITPYLWMAGIQADVRQGRYTGGGVDVSFSDITGSLNAAFMGTFEARKGPWGLLLDTMYMSVSVTGETPDRAIGEVDLKVTQGMYSLAGFYRVVEKPFALDLLGGVRYATVEADLDIGPGKYPQIMQGRSVSKSTEWWDGFAGMRAQFPLSERWSLVGYFDVGAGGSNFTFQALAGVNFQVSKHFVIKGGYRYLAIDLRDSEFVYDVKVAGPYLALGIRF